MWFKKYLGHKMVGLFDGFGNWMTGYQVSMMSQGFLPFILGRHHVWSRRGWGDKILIDYVSVCETEEKYKIIKRGVEPSCEELKHWQLGRGSDLGIGRMKRK